MNTVSRRQRNQPTYNLQPVKYGPVDRDIGESLQCPECLSVLATRIYGIGGYLTWRDGHTRASKLLPFGLPAINEHGSTGPGKRWKSCYQLPFGFVSKGGIKSGDYKGVRKYMYDLKEYQLPKRPGSLKNAVKDCSMGWESKRYWKIHHLQNRNPEHIELIEEWYKSELTLAQIYKAAVSLKMNTTFSFDTPYTAETVRESVEKVNSDFRRMAPEYQLALTEPELPAAIICPKCSDKYPGQTDSLGVIISVTD